MRCGEARAGRRFLNVSHSARVVYPERCRYISKLCPRSDSSSLQPRDGQKRAGRRRLGARSQVRRLPRQARKEGLNVRLYSPMGTSSPNGFLPSHSCCTSCQRKPQCSTATSWPTTPTAVRTSPGFMYIELADDRLLWGNIRKSDMRWQVLADVCGDGE